jgi:hypothetical protein
MLKIGTKYNISPINLDYCIKIGTERNTRNIKAGIIEQKTQIKKSGVDISIQGVIGEFCMMDLLRLDKSELNDTTPRSRKTDQGDFIFNGLKFDVKCAEGGHHWPLKVRSQNKEFPANIYVLCTMIRLNKSFRTPEDVHICTYKPDENIELIYQGCVTSDQIFNFKYRRGMDYFYPQEKLIELEEAVNIKPLPKITFF